MTHTYTITGMTCSNCVAKVKSGILKLPDVLSADVTLPGKTTIEMDKHIPVNVLQQAISPDKKYLITEDTTQLKMEETKSLLVTYKPLFLIFSFITGISLITSFYGNTLQLHVFMNHFMAGFFIVFSFFKLLNLKAFANSYAMYDVLAMKVKWYGFVYPFIELLLGLAYLTGFHPLATNITTVIVMGFSSTGVIKSVMNKQKINCACLGAVFNLPMSTITIIEDLLMVAMAGAMIMYQLFYNY